MIEHPGFRRDLKRLLKKYPSLKDDLKVLEKMLLKRLKGIREAGSYSMSKLMLIAELFHSR